MQRVRGAAAVTGLDALRERLNPVPEGDCLVGLSGGADSVALTYLLLPLRDSGALRLTAAHVNHGLRGENSDGDEAFVRMLCAREGIPLRTVSPDLGGKRDENTAREARYGAFFRIMEEEDIPTLILAHQRDDQAETFLMRLLRGAGAEGLSAMRRREERNGRVLLRPMLDISGSELRQALTEAGISWREDDSNRDTAYLRNRIRRELMPELEEIAPGAAGRIARTAEIIAREDDAASARADALLRELEGPGGLNAEGLRKEPQAMRIRVLRAWWREQGPTLAERELSYEQTLRLEGLLDAPRGTIINLPAGWRARREKECLRLMDPTDKTKNNRPERAERKKHD